MIWDVSPDAATRATSEVANAADDVIGLNVRSVLTKGKVLCYFSKYHDLGV